MPSLATLLSYAWRRPTVTLRINGARVPGVVSAEVTQEAMQDLSTATVEVIDVAFVPEAGMPISWTWGLSGVEVPGFTGYITSVQQVSYPAGFRLVCADVLWLAQRQTRDVETSPLNDISATDAITYLLATYAGITRVSLPTIARPSDSGTAWNLGHLTPVSFQNTTTLNACQQIARTAGYWLYADAGGTVRAVLLERRPSNSPARTYKRGRDLLLDGAPRRDQNVEQVKNQITVLGASTGVEGAQLRDVYLATHVLSPGVVSNLNFQSTLLEYEADVTAVAARLAGLWNRRPNIVTFTVAFDPTVHVGATVAIQDSGISFASPKPFFVYRTRHRVAPATGQADIELVLDGGIGDAGYSTIPPPVAVIALGALYTETINGGDTLVEVTVDGSGSYSQSEGEIVSYAWSTSGTYGSTPTSAATVKATFIYLASASPVTITLTVTDTSSKTNTATLVLDLATGDGTTPPTTEAWSVAAGAAWELTPDGGATWREHVATTTLVPDVGAGVWPTAALGDAVAHGALASGGTALRQTLDSLGSSPTTLSTAPASITALYVNPRNAARVWRACGPTVYRSLDGGTTWASWGAPLGGTDVVGLIEDPALNDSVFACAGANLYHATAAGSWGVLYAGPSGAIARQVVRSDDGTVTWLAFTDAGGGFTGAPFVRIEGNIGVTPTGVTEGRAIALTDAVEPASPRLVAIGDTNLIAVVDALTGDILTESAATFPVGTVVQHAAASREIPMALIACFDSVASGTGAVYKYLVDADALLAFRNLATGRQAHRVGLVGVTQAIAAEVIWLPWAESGAQDALYRLKDAVFTPIAPPQAGWYWLSITVSPFNPDWWLIRGNTLADGSTVLSGGKLCAASTTVSPLWLTLDAGATWTEVQLTGLSAATDITPMWLDNGTIAVLGGGAGTGKTQLWRLDPASPSGAATEISGSVDSYPAAAGISGEIVTAEYAVDSALRYVSSAGALSSRVGSTLGGRITALQHLPNSRAAVLIVGSGPSSDLYYTPNYLTTGPAQKVANVAYAGDAVSIYAQGLAAASHGVYVGDRAGGVLRVVDVAGAPSTSTPIGTGTVGSVAVDEQTRSVAGVLTTNQDLYYSIDGESWAFQTRPPDAGGLAYAFAIVVRSS